MTEELNQKLKKTYQTYGESELERVIAGLSINNYHSIDGRYSIDKAKTLIKLWGEEDLPKAGNKYRCIYVPSVHFVYARGQVVECNQDRTINDQDSWSDSKLFKQCFELVEKPDVSESEDMSFYHSEKVGLNLADEAKHSQKLLPLPQRDIYKHTGYTEQTKHKGLRFNSGKLRYDLVHPFAHEQMVKVLTRGAEKYAERNWENGMAWSNVISSLKRHLACIEKGEDYDSETGELHAAHLACNAHFLTAYYKIYPQGDDRPHTYLSQPKIGLDIDEVIADFVGKWCEHHKVTTPEFWNFDKDMASKFQEVANDKEFWMSIKPKISPKDLPFEPHCYITSRPILNEWTEQWLQDNGFPAVPVYTVGYGESKVEVAKASGIDIFVDDRYENFVELNKAGICTFLMDATHNQRYIVGHKRIYSLKELI